MEVKSIDEGKIEWCISAFDQIVVLSDRHSDAGDVGLPEVVPAENITAYLARDGEERSGVHHRVSDWGDEADHAGAGRTHTEAELTDEDVAQLVAVLPHGEVEGHDRVAGCTKHCLHILADECLAHDLGAGLRLRHHSSLASIYRSSSLIMRVGAVIPWVILSVVAGERPKYVFLNVSHINKLEGRRFYRFLTLWKNGGFQILFLKVYRRLNYETLHNSPRLNEY